MFAKLFKRKYNVKKIKVEKADAKRVSYIQLFRYATTQDKICIAVGSISGIIGGVITSYAQIVQADKLSDGVGQFVIYATILGIAVIMCTYLTGVLYRYSALKQIFRIRKLFFKKMLNMDISWYDVNKIGDFATAFTDNLSKLEEGIGEKVGIFIFFESTFTVSIIVALIRGWQLALICLVSFPISLVLTIIIFWLSTSFSQQEMEAMLYAGAVAEEVLSSIRTVVAFDGQEKEQLRYNNLLKTAKINNIRKGLFSGIGNGCMWILMYASYSLSFWYGIRLVLNDEENMYTPTNLVSVFLCSVIAMANFGSAAPYFEIFGTACGAATRVFEILDAEPVINLNKNFGVKPKTMRGDIVFENVGFHFPSRPEVEILRDFNMKVKSGETVAFVGTSGCGKSTCIQLIQRFYDVTAGTVTIDDYNIKKLNLVWLRGKMGVVGQEPTLFATTIGENIRYGKLSATQADIERAAKKANVHNFIQSLPRSYNTVVGGGGALLSGGQKQRIALARALIRKPKILLLDEATSALDLISEAEIQKTLDAISGECTTIIVAHRLSTIRNASRIVVMSEGNVLEQGNHCELMEKHGEYYKLVISQGISHINDESTEKKSTIGVDNVITDISLLSDPEEALSENVLDDSAWSKEESLIISILKVNSPEWFYICVGCIASIIAGAGLPTCGIIFGEIIGILGDSRDWYIRQESNRFCIYLLILGIAVGLTTFIQIYYFSISGERLTLRIGAKMFEAMLSQEMAWFDRKENGVGALCAKLAGEAASVQGVCSFTEMTIAGITVGTVLNSMSTFIISITFALYFEWRLALVLIAFSPIFLLCAFFEKKLTQDNTTSQKILEKSANIAVEAAIDIRTIASLGCEKIFYDNYVKELKPYIHNVKREMHFRSVILGVVRSILFFANAAAMVSGAKLIVSRNLDFGTVFKVAQTVMLGLWSIGNVFSFTPNFNKGLLAAGRIFELLRRVPKIRNLTQPSYLDDVKGNVDYSNVHFAYSTRPSVSILNGLNLNILQGKTVALVGISGCGKSTIIQLLERYYDPLVGEITIDKEDIKNVDISNIRSHLGIVFQNPNLFNRTIAENIAYGANHRNINMNEIVQAAKSANIHNFISSLPMGYDTNLGNRGMQLSGGQKQRVAIACVLVRNPRILILDEATSALDNKSEKIVRQALYNTKKDRTCITVAHRLTTIQDADVICVLNGGVVAEMGTHSVLLERRGLYYDFYKLQLG